MRIHDGKSLFLTKSLPTVDHFQVNFKEIGTLQINLKGKSCCLIFQVHLLCNPCFKRYFPVYPINSLFKLFDISISLVISLLVVFVFLFIFTVWSSHLDILFNAVIILFGQCKKITSPIFSFLEPQEPCGTMQSTNFKHAELSELKD